MKKVFSFMIELFICNWNEIENRSVHPSLVEKSLLRHMLIRNSFSNEHDSYLQYSHLALGIKFFNRFCVMFFVNFIVYFEDYKSKIARKKNILPTKILLQAKIWKKVFTFISYNIIFVFSWTFLFCTLWNSQKNLILKVYPCLNVH